MSTAFQKNIKLCMNFTLITAFFGLMIFVSILLVTVFDAGMILLTPKELAEIPNLIVFTIFIAPLTGSLLVNGFLGEVDISYDVETGESTLGWNKFYYWMGPWGSDSYDSHPIAGKSKFALCLFYAIGFFGTFAYASYMFILLYGTTKGYILIGLTYCLLFAAGKSGREMRLKYGYSNNLETIKNSIRVKESSETIL